MANPVQETLKGYQKSWLLLTQAMLWIAATIAGFLMPPPAGTLDESKVWVRFAQFVITIFVGLLLLVALRWKRKKDVLRWALLAIASLALGTGAFFTYEVLAARWTTSYNQQRVVIGDSFTAQASEYSKAHPNLTANDLVMHYAGDLEKIWTRETLQQRRLILAANYVFATPLFTICVISILQALQCATGAPTKKRPATTSAAKEEKRERADASKSEPAQAEE